MLKPLISPSDLLYLCPFSFTLSSSSCVKPSKAPRTRTTSARFVSGVLKYDISMFFTKDLQRKANSRLENDCLSKTTGNWLSLSQTMLSHILHDLFVTEKLEILPCTVRKENTLHQYDNGWENITASPGTWVATGFGWGQPLVAVGDWVSGWNAMMWLADFDLFGRLSWNLISSEESRKAVPF